MDRIKIIKLCEQILSAGNHIRVEGEQNMAQVIGVCQAARMIAEEIQREDGEETDG